MSVTGLAGTPYAGLAGNAYCTPLGELDLTQRELASDFLARVKGLRAETLIPILESGLSGSVAYVVEGTVTGERLSNRLDRERRIKPWYMAAIVTDIVNALGVAHEAGISHGMVVPATIWIGESGPAKLGASVLTVEARTWIRTSWRRSVSSSCPACRGSRR